MVIPEMRIGFIFPSSEYLFDPFKGDPHTHFQILTVLESRFGGEVELCLPDLRGIKREFAVYHIPECDIYLHSVYTLDWEEQISIVRELREKYPAAKHVAGGPHATVFQQETLKHFDALVIGDGEEQVISLITDLKSNKLKKIYEEKNIIDINKYPFPKRHFLPKATIARKGLMTLKNKKGFDQLLGTTVIFSRGCPFECYFCAMPKVKEYCKGVRYRKPEFVKEEIEYLKKEYKLQGISLLDEIGVPYGKEQAIKHLEAIGSTNITWRGQCRADGITPEIAELLKNSGCVTMCLGVESASQVSLDIINKKINVEKAKEAIKLLESKGIECRVYMIIGLPGEPENIVDLTWEFIQETKPASVYLSILTVRPGTVLFDDPKKFGMKNIGTDWSKTMHMYGRYKEEIPSLTFEYDAVNPWGGKGMTREQIVANYLELQSRLHKAGISRL